ncbi:MAG: hypothetical protein ACTSQG_00085 [Promethearchaeota archaeon]
MNELKTSEQWQKIFKETIVYDPDGWDRNNFKFSWFEELISRKEYEKRLIYSSCVPRRKKVTR